MDQNRLDSARANGVATMLVVEDVVALRRLLRRYVESLGYRVVDAAGGREALRRFADEGQTFAGALIDIAMPGMNGVDLAHALVERSPGFPVVLMSGYATPALRAHNDLDAGRAFLAKPFTLDLLARTLRRVLDDRAAPGCLSNRSSALAGIAPG